MQSHQVVAAGLLAIAAIANTAAQTSAAPSAVPVPGIRYGAAIGLESAQKVVARAVQEAQKQALYMCIAITDPSGELIHFARMDDCQTGSINVAISKSRSAALFRRPTREFREAMAAGHTYVAFLPGAMPVDGGVPLIVNGRVVGAIGVSGGTGAQDAAVAIAAASLLQ